MTIDAMKYSLALLVFLITSATPALARTMADDLRVENAAIRQPPTGAVVAAMYMRLHNKGEATLRLKGAHTPAATQSELHNHLHEDGMMTMRQVAEIAVPAGASVELKPGGLHLMMIELQQPLRAGDTVPVTLALADGSEVTIVATVQRRAADDR